MIIKDKHLFNFPLFMAFAKIVLWFLKRRYNKMVIHDIEIRPNHSYLLLCNHVGYLDGLWASNLIYHAIHKKQKLSGFNFMSLKKQLQKNPWMRYLGSFSIVPGSRTSTESLTYAAEILSKPGNVLFMFPQGNLESQYVRKIEVKDGLETIIPLIKGKCQIIWSSNLTEYFESTKPSIYYHMLDCGDNNSFNLEALKEKINKHHKEAIQKQFRFTNED